MNIKAIINPNAGRLGAPQEMIWGLKRLHKEGLIEHLELHETDHEGHGREIASENHDGFDMLLVSGGDGTQNNVVNGMMTSDSKIPLLICATGTVNDFAVANRLPQNFKEVEELLHDYSVAPVDIGEAEGKYFLNVAAGGFMTDVSFLTPRTAKMLLGQLAYYITGMFNLHQIFNPYELRIETEDFTYEDEFFFFLFTNCHSVGGFRNMVPQASVQDGQFDLMCIKSDLHFLKPSIIPLLTGILNGEHLSHPAVYHIQADEVKISSDRPMVLDLDGEKGPELPITLKVHQRALDLVLPPQTLEKDLYQDFESDKEGA